jgi:uncharacterized protein
MIKEIQALGLRLMISFDHLPSAPSVAKQRIYSDGRDSSQQVVNNVKMAMENGLTPELSITVSGRNLVTLPETLAWALEHDIPFYLNFYRESECSLARPSADELRFDDQKMIEGMFAA